MAMARAVAMHRLSTDTAYPSRPLTHHHRREDIRVGLAAGAADGAEEEEVCACPADVSLTL